MHEVNNPLEALTNLVYITKNEPANPDRVQRNMEIAESQLLRLGEIARKTLSFYRDQTETKDFDLAEIVESALKVHLHRAQRQNVDIRKRVTGPAMASVFSGEILQILSNLILNSLDALPESAAVLCVRVGISQDKVHVTIADNGAGIEPSIYNNMFQPHLTTKRNGTGLGLWLSRRIIEKHNGTLICRARVSQGAWNNVSIVVAHLAGLLCSTGRRGYSSKTSLTADVLSPMNDQKDLTAMPADSSSPSEYLAERRLIPLPVRQSHHTPPR